MVTITFRIPSKKTQYGYVEIIQDGIEEMPSPEKLAQDYQEYIQRFVRAEIAADPKRVDSLLVENVFLDFLKDEVSEVGTALDEESVKEILRTELGARVVSETPAPWDGRGAVPENLEPKPWQKGARKAPAADLFA